MALKRRKHAVEIGDRVYFGDDKDDMGTVMDVWYGTPRDFDGSFFSPHWRVLVQWDKNAHSGKAPGELMEFTAEATHPVETTDARSGGSK